MDATKAKILAISKQRAHSYVPSLQSIDPAPESLKEMRELIDELSLEQLLELRRDILINPWYAEALQEVLRRLGPRR
jgi:hypothetical protein